MRENERKIRKVRKFIAKRTRGSIYKDRQYGIIERKERVERGKD